jgi:acyl carrier protein
MIDKADVYQVIENNMRLVIGALPERDFDPSLSILDHGANSLELVEIVSRTMRELQVRVPRSRLNRVETIDELADEIVLASKRGSSGE